MSTMARDEEFDQLNKEAINKKMERRRHKIQDIFFQKKNTLRQLNGSRSTK